MTGTSLSLVLACSVAILVASTAASAGTGPSPREPTTAGALAASPDPSLSVDSCTTAQVGDEFTVDIRASDVTNLLAWEVYFAYDRDIVEVVGRDVRLFLASQPGSNVFDLSDPVPNSTGLYRVAAADLGSKEAAETGAGILARLTMTAKAAGVSAASISPIDVNGDGVGDLGATLTGANGQQIGDQNGDGLFDGTTSSGQIAVGESCAPTPPEPPVISPLPTAATPAPPAESAGPAPATSSPTATDGQASPTETAVPARTQATSPTSSSPSATNQSNSSSGTGLSSWAIALIAAGAAGLLLGMLFIMRSRRLT